MRIKKVQVDELQPGDYICRLDRPWEETPLPYRGFQIESRGEIRTIQQYCQHVWISAARPSQSEDPATAANAASDAQGRLEPISRDSAGPATRNRTQEKIDFREATRQVNTTRKIVADTCAGVLEQTRRGKEPDTGRLHATVEDLQEELNQYPHAGLWLLSLRDQSDALVDHSVNVCGMTLLLLRHLEKQAGKQVTEESATEIGMAALLHDIGKTLLPPRLIYRDGAISADDWAQIHAHPQIGARILRKGGMPEAVCRIVRHHHERIDGTGFPDQLEGPDICLSWRMVGLVNAYDAMTSKWPRSPAISGYQALRSLARDAEQGWGKNLVQQFTEMMGIYPPGTPVLLDNGKEGIVVASQPKSRLKPVIAVPSRSRGKGMEVSMLDLARNEDHAQIQSVTAPDSGHRKLLLHINRTSLGA